MSQVIIFVGRCTVVPQRPSELQRLLSEFQVRAPRMEGLNFSCPAVASSTELGAAYRGIDYVALAALENSQGWSLSIPPRFTLFGKVFNCLFIC